MVYMAKYVKVCKYVLKGITNDSHCKSSGQDLRKDMCLGISDEELILCKKKNEMLHTRYHTQTQAILGELRRRNRFYELK